MKKDKTIWVVVPTIRDESMKLFREKWNDLFNLHSVTLIEVHDGETPKVTIQSYNCYHKAEITEWDEVKDFVYNYNDGVRNFGFYIVAKYGKPEDVIITLDDDCYPNNNDPIQEHLDILSTKHPVSWVSTAENEYMRGFPYWIREEAEVKVSHGVWANVPDLDAPTQLVKGVKSEYIFKRGVIPKGIYFPFCIMNVAFTYDVLPYLYQAPSGRNCPDQIDRFADIWCGVNLTRHAEAQNFAIATGFSSIWHDRASNVFDNLTKESKGLRYNETYWLEDPDSEYFKNYNQKRELWETTIKKMMLGHTS